MKPFLKQFHLDIPLLAAESFILPMPAEFD
jgi:hypothetical protein